MAPTRMAVATLLPCLCRKTSPACQTSISLAWFTPEFGEDRRIDEERGDNLGGDASK